jgi:WD40 repeat protein
MTSPCVAVIDLSKMEVVRTLKGHPTALWCVDFSIEEDYVVSGGQHGNFIAWRLSDGESTTHTRHTTHARTRCILFRVRSDRFRGARAVA